MILRLPFPILKKFTFERPIEIVFKLATLEIATKEVLKCDLWEVEKFPAEEVNVAILYAGYITACKDNYLKPKYDETDAAFWVQKMSKESEKLFYEGIQKLMGTLRETKDKVKEVKKK